MCILRHALCSSLAMPQLFKPAAKIPRNQFEAFLLAASDGDGKGMWWVHRALGLLSFSPLGNLLHGYR